jgi:pyruvate formate lyase activating enzyme
MSRRKFIKTCTLGSGAIILNMPAIDGSNLLPSMTTKWQKKARYYSETPRGLRCEICPNECNIKVGETGDCRNRINLNDVLYSMAYGNPCSVHLDPVEKGPFYHFLPSSKTLSVATAGCNLACLNCHNWEISQTSPKKTKNYDLMPEPLVNLAIEKDCRSISYTYSEPVTFFEYTEDTAKVAQANGLKNVLVSAGFINEKPLRQLAKNLDAANIDLKSFSNKIYRKLNGGKLDPILNTLKLLKSEGVWLEITNLVIPSWTDDFDMIQQMCGWLLENGFEDTPLHFSRFYPQFKLTQLPPTPISTLKKAQQIAREEGLKYVYIGNAPSPESSVTFCPNCEKSVVERRGYRILRNYLIQGKCKYCNTMIPGVWD